MTQHIQKKILDSQKEILKVISGITEIPTGAHSLRINGKSFDVGNSENITVVPKKEGNGFDMYIKPGTVETAYIPVVIDESGVREIVYNDFHVGEGANVTIIAGCGIHSCGQTESQHDGVHSFYLKPDAKVRYVEKHYGAGDEESTRILNPVTNAYLDKNAHMEMETVQIRGILKTDRVTNAELKEKATIVVTEKLMTDRNEEAITSFNVILEGNESSANVVSRSVARGSSIQTFYSKIIGAAECFGHSECDAIIMDHAHVAAIPQIDAKHVDATLIHEAAIGKIAGEQITKLMTLGFTQEEAEAKIVESFLK